MLVQILTGIFITVLVGYIIFLHLQLSRKNIFIETTVRKLSGIEKNRNMEEMISFLKELQKLSQYSTYSADKLLEDSSVNFIMENEREMMIYMHYTRYDEDAKSILKEGFMFTDSFYKTALPVSKDKLDIKIHHNSRKYYGEYIILICIAKDIANFYSMELEKAGIRQYSYENILSETLPSKNDNSDLVYRLSHQFIKGYINNKTGELVKNPDFDPWYNSPAFMKNIEYMKNI